MMEHIKTIIQCDAEGCTYQIEINAGKEREYINRPCPICNANLLTEDDFMSSQKANKAANFLNSLDQEQVKMLSKLLEAEKIDLTAIPGHELLKGEEGVLLRVGTHNGISIEGIEPI